MLITPDQEIKFHAQPIPSILEGTVFAVSGRKVIRGKEALVAKVYNAQGDSLALKWYASLSGAPMIRLADYAAAVKRDEQGYYRHGLNPEQVPPTNFFISSESSSAQELHELYAQMSWIDGPLLRNVEFREVLQNRTFRESLANLFYCSYQFSKETGRFPDLKGGDPLLYTPRLDNPLGIVWPLRSSNIKKSGDTAVLIDARTLERRPTSPKYWTSRVHQELTLVMARRLMVI